MHLFKFNDSQLFCCKNGKYESIIYKKVYRLISENNTATHLTTEYKSFYFVPRRKLLRTVF